MKQTFFLLVLFLLSICLKSQNINISGKVIDNDTKQSLQFASIFLKENKKGSSTDIQGDYKITTYKGKYTLVCSFIGYKNYEKQIILKNDTIINIQLEPQIISSEQIIVTSERSDKNVKSTDIGLIKVPIKEIKKLPVVFGETDILKTIQLLPGVQAGGEGSNTFYVRGGASDQNLITIDGATVYNPSHAAGFFSVFNTDIISTADIYKGGMEPRFGGRLSSVLDINTKVGNKEKYSGKFGIGLISSNLFIEGPIQKSKSSFIIGARRTYADIIMKPFTKNTDLEGIGANFYDLNAKLSFQLSKKDFLNITGYYGKDYFGFEPKNTSIGYNINWGNAIGVVKWSHIFSNSLALTVTANTSDYKLKMEGFESSYNFDMYSGIRDYTASADLNWQIDSSNNIRIGGGYTNHTFSPSSFTTFSLDTEFDIKDIMKFHNNEIFSYIQHEYDLNSKLKILYGLRYSYFSHVGPYTRYKIDNIFYFNNIDSIVYKPNKTIKAYNMLEPRINVRYALSKSQSIKASFTINKQNINMVPMSSMVLPTDVWYPSTELIPPQKANQISAGYFHNFFDDFIETSLEFYYKKMDNLLEVNPHANTLNSLNSNPDHIFITGKGTSYGAEFFVNKTKGKLTGWLSYTLSKTTRNFDEINNGATFYARYDRRHDISLTLRYELNKKWDFSTIWVFSSGNAATIPNSFYIIDGNTIVEYGEYNAWRMPDYHRLDLSANWKVIDKKKYNGYLNFSIYNAYSRKNAYIITFMPEINQNNSMKYKAYKITIFPILPSISFTLEIN